MIASNQLDKAFSALADPTRRAILQRLSQTPELSVSALAEPFALSLPAVSKHILVLQEAGLVSKRVARQRRPVRLEVEQLRSLQSWFDETEALWAQRFRNLEQLLEENSDAD